MTRPAQHLSCARRLARGGVVATLAVIAIIALLTAASAEVCDKAVGDDWRSEHGPVWLLNPVGFPVDLTLLIGGLALVRITRQRWLGYVALGLIALSIYGHLYDVILQHQVYQFELSEGCRSVATDLLNVVLLIAFFGAFFWLDGALNRLPRRAE
jgi:hypothetical protein